MTNPPPPAHDPKLPVALVVEDDGPLLDLAAQILERAGYRTIRAGSAEEAVAVAADEHLALLFTDVVLPGRSGLELAAELASERRDLPVLITTGQWDDAVRHVAVERAGHLVLRKPYTAQQVVNAAMTVRAAVAGGALDSDAAPS